MESIKILPASEGLGFTYTKNGHQKVTATIQPNLKAQWSNIFENPVFQRWVMRFIHNNACQLSKIHIENCSEDCQYIEMVVDALSSEKGQTIQQKLMLSPSEVNVLIVFPAKAFDTETCLLIREPCMINGMEDNFVIPKGQFVSIAASNGQKEYVFSSPHSNALKSCIGMTLEKNKLIPISEIAAKEVYGNDMDASGLSSCFVQRCNVNADKVRQCGSEYYLYYCNIDASLAERLQAAISKATDAQAEMSQYKQFRLVPFNELWKSTTDSASLTSAFLYSSLKKSRQITRHELLSCGRPEADLIPNVLRSVEAPKKAAKFSKVSSLCPTSKNINIKVKVVEPISKKDKANNSWEMLVGDDGAIASLRLTEGQLNLPDVVNTPLFIRNAHVIMDNGHMHLAVGRWGKISVATNEEMDQFNFSVGTVKNMSEVEYELVIIEDSNGFVNMTTEKPLHKSERSVRSNRNRRPMSKQSGKQEETYEDIDVIPSEQYRMPTDRAAASMKKREPKKVSAFSNRRNRSRGRGGRARHGRQPVLVN